MKICVAQTNPVKGDIQQNIDHHIKLIKKAILKEVDMVMFPELSLTGYELELAKELASNQNDVRLDIFQELSDAHSMIIGVGMPTKENGKIFISMIIFQPQKERLTYSKQYLYKTESGHVNEGHRQIYINADHKHIIAPAICYELSVPQHSENAHRNHANIYMASVLNSIKGVDDDLMKLSGIAKKYHMTTFMANYVGQSGGYDCAGKSSVWNGEGTLIGQLNDQNEGLLYFNTETKEVMEEMIK